VQLQSTMFDRSETLQNDSSCDQISISKTSVELTRPIYRPTRSLVVPHNSITSLLLTRPNRYTDARPRGDDSEGYAD